MEDLRREVDLLHAEVKLTNDKLDRINEAFPKNEDGNPNYYGHRFFHRKQEKSAEEYSATRSKILKDVLSWIAIGVLTIIGSALVHSYILPAVPVTK